MTSSTLFGFWKKSLVVMSSAAWTAVICVPLALAPPAMAAEGDTIDNSGYIPFEQAYFAFEVESPLGSLKEVPIWDEIEQMLDNPYQIALEPTVEGNDQGWPSYRSTQLRRRSFIYRNGAGQPCAPLTDGCTEVPLQRHLVHPLNYNHSTGEELRLLNPEYEGGPWFVPGALELAPDGSYVFNNDNPITVSPGEGRVEEEGTAPDFNSPIAPDTYACIVSVDQFFTTEDTGLPAPNRPGVFLVPEGTTICGGDPGEPGYEGFGEVDPAEFDDQYSTPAVPGLDGPDQIWTGQRLFDPAGCTQRNLESPGSCSPAAVGGLINRLRKPTLRATPASQPDYLQNSVEELEVDPTDLTPSNENDYIRGFNRAQKLVARDAAAALGKALFWDMQVGSDSVQACATCHFSAGVDNRTKNQTNPNHVGEFGGDVTLQLHGGFQNTNLTVTDFPFQRGGQDTDNGPDNLFGNVNDVASSMGVRFRHFVDIPVPGLATSFAPLTGAPFGVRTLLPDIGLAVPDPIPLFQGLRRVEPRNTPTIFNAAMNFDNFWDGRARHDFNGGSVFGPSDPQSHVFVAANPLLPIVATRQVIRFSSLASLATGPALSEFEMSFLGRNWPKLGKKLLQGTGAGATRFGTVTPLANQLVSTTDSVLGPWSNQGGSACPSLAGFTILDRSASWAAAGVANKPGLCISYPGLIRRAFYPTLWQSTVRRLDGCYAGGDGSPQSVNTPQCAVGTVAISVFDEEDGVVEEIAADPFDGYVLTPNAGIFLPNTFASNTNQFTQMEANMSLFFGLALQTWVTMLVPDDSPADRFFDTNPDSHVTFGESGEPGIARDLLNCSDTGGAQPCFTPVGNFQRDPGVLARVGCTLEGAGNCDMVPAGGNRTAAVDPLLGLDFFLGSNLSLKNPNFRSLRCGECHAGGTLTDNTFEISHQASFGDRIQEFVTGQPGVEKFPEALGRGRVITGFMLEGELQENAQDGIERNIADFCTVGPCTSDPEHSVVGGFPQGQALFDNGVYNIGVTPITNDRLRGGNDAFGWPLALGVLAFKNLGGLDYHPGGNDPDNGFAQPAGIGNPLPNFDPAIDPTGGGIFEPTGQDQQINPGFAEEPCPDENAEGECIGFLPAYLSPWASNIPVGDESNIDELFVGLNTVMREPMKEGFVDSFGPFNPAAILGESFNNARAPEMAMWPNVNRVNHQGNAKAPPLRFVEKTGPYFHNGGKLTLRQQLDFYVRGGDFPRTNAAHRDFLIANLLLEDEALGGLDPATGETEFTLQQREEIIVSVIDFLLELTDERVDFQRAPFDQVEIFVPLDGAAPDNGSLAGAVTAGRQGFMNNIAGDCGNVPGTGACFLRVLATGAGGKATPTPNFLGVSNVRIVGNGGVGPTCSASAVSHYCSTVIP